MFITTSKLNNHRYYLHITPCMFVLREHTVNKKYSRICIARLESKFFINLGFIRLPCGFRRLTMEENLLPEEPSPLLKLDPPWRIPSLCICTPSITASPSSSTPEVNTNTDCFFLRISHGFCFVSTTFILASISHRLWNLLLIIISFSRDFIVQQMNCIVLNKNQNNESTTNTN